MANERVHKKACLRCGGDMTDGQLRRQRQEEWLSRRGDEEIDSVYGYLRAVVQNCWGATVEAIRHQLVGILARPMDPGDAQRMRERGLGDLVERHEALVRETWAEYGYGAEGESDA